MIHNIELIALYNTLAMVFAVANVFFISFYGKGGSSTLIYGSNKAQRKNMLSRKYSKMKRPMERIRARARVDFEKWNMWTHHRPVLIPMLGNVPGINPTLCESKYVRYHMVVSIRYRYLFGGFINSYNAVREIFQIEYLTGFDVSDLIIKLMDHSAMAIGSPVTKMKVKKLRDEGTSLSTNY